ncbi:superoxide dismutase [Candidatus Peregrinibacteria bacterium]|nr:superoxide dismutase [Candidatus Peregrinibacteria bacterium]MCB9804715.1 superoxide dismutase [Candidatus Peribacteria bacterium]
MITKPSLHYALNALEPVISQETLEYHSGKHHQTYVDNLNKLIAGTSQELDDLETIIHHSNGGVFNNAAQIWNHTFYFDSLSPEALARGEANLPNGALAEKINAKWGSFEVFWSAYADLAVKTFGSGWAWLVEKQDGSLDIVSTSNAETPLTNNTLNPLLAIDVWEHAYYIDYRNLRVQYVESMKKVIDWGVVAGRMK